MTTKYSFTIPAEYANTRLDQVLVQLMPDYSRTQIQDCLLKGNILVNGQIIKGKTKLKGGELIQAEIILKPQPEWVAEPIELEIIYEDDALLIINKPVGMVVHPGAGNSNRTLLNALLHYAPSLKELPRAGILHRLDKDTSGLLIIAKTAQSLKNLSQQLKNRSIVREYQAIVYGAMISGGKIDAPIDRHPLQRKRMAIVDTGKSAITHYRVMEKFPHFTHLKIRLETGRTHQIRVHMQHINHPIVGDQTYARVKLAKHMSEELIQQIREFKRQALHAFAIELKHPDTNEIKRWEIGLAEDMQQLLILLRNDSKK